MASPLLPPLLSLTRASHNLPSSGDISFARSLDRSLVPKLEHVEDRLGRIVQKVGGAGLKGDWEEEQDWKRVWSAVEDKFLDTADTLVDQHINGIKQPAASTSDLILRTGATTTLNKKQKLPKHLYDPPNTPKPQLLFPKHLQFDNSPYTEFVPLYPPPDDVDIPDPRSHPSVYDDPGEDARNWEGSFDRVPMSYVDTVENFKAMLEQIRNSSTKELAVDLEHHDYHSYAGILCVMQISTREKDWVIDVLKPDLRGEIHRLKEFFEDPEWIKVFHGATMDVQWLQRDFGIYLVSLFDTYEASKALVGAGYKKHNLAALLQTFCNFDADKRYQLADWRIRPLPSEMLHYARADTHFLLYVYDRLRHTLHNLATDFTPPEEIDPSPQSLIAHILTRSKATSSKRYRKDPLGVGPGSWVNIFKKSALASAGGVWAADGTGIAYEVGSALSDWRDMMARKSDESHRYVLSPQKIIQLATLRPTTASDVVTICYPPSIILAKHSSGVVKIIKRTVEQVEIAIQQKPKTKLGALLGLPTQKSRPRVPSVEEPKMERKGVNPLPGLWNNSNASTSGTILARVSTLFTFGSSKDSESKTKKDKKVNEVIRSIVQAVRLSDSFVQSTGTGHLQSQSVSQLTKPNVKEEPLSQVPTVNKVSTVTNVNKVTELIGSGSLKNEDSMEIDADDEIVVASNLIKGSASTSKGKKKRKREERGNEVEEIPATSVQSESPKKKKQKKGLAKVESQVDYSVMDSLLDVPPPLVETGSLKRSKSNSKNPKKATTTEKKVGDLTQGKEVKKRLKIEVNPKRGNMSGSFPS